MSRRATSDRFDDVVSPLLVDPIETTMATARSSSVKINPPSPPSPLFTKNQRSNVCDYALSACSRKKRWQISATARRLYHIVLYQWINHRTRTTLAYYVSLAIYVYARANWVSNAKTS